MTTTLHDQLRERAGLRALAEGDAVDRRAHEEGQHEDAPRPDGSDRYAIYNVVYAPVPGGMKNERRVVATTSRDGIGLCLVTLREEEQITGDSRIGILDRETRQWIINPWGNGR